MRIAYLSIGGHIHTERWLRYFVDRGHDVHLLSVDPVPIDGVTVHDLRTRIPWKPLHYGVGVLKIRSILGAIQPDLLHVHFLQGYGYWSVFAGFHPLVLTVWGDDVYLAPRLSRLRSYLSRRAVEKADLITGDSQDILREVERLGGDRAKLHQILWGVDFDRFQPQDGAAFRRQWDIPEQAPLVLSTRSFSRDYYNIDVILEMLPSLRERVPGTIIAFAAYDGEGLDLRRRADELGVTRAVRFLGRVEHHALPQVLSAADVFVSVPSVDATSVSLLEAMACAGAIVASDLPSNREWITDGENGYLVPPRDLEALVDRTARLLVDRSTREAFGKKSERIARERAGHRENMARMEGLCQDLVHRRSGGPAQASTDRG